ncbi:hypothetical protein [Larkinella terrae]|uniref:Uncharacterized protein n=1 Tax=Larkinella terrae TaxID=2025311 RepID=A0A7K0EEV5_9BACT|nr:hypothetical protein [Larkinella terrae]MRS60242.1 hypothetical protein [Larkinella terrae]
MNTVRRLGQWTGLTLLTLAVFLLAIYFFVSHSIHQRMDKHYTFAAEQLTIPQDQATLERGKHLAFIKPSLSRHYKPVKRRRVINSRGVSHTVFDQTS